MTVSVSGLSFIFGHDTSPRSSGRPTRLPDIYLSVLTIDKSGKRGRDEREGVGSDIGGEWKSYLMAVE